MLNDKIRLWTMLAALITTVGVTLGALGRLFGPHPRVVIGSFDLIGSLLSQIGDFLLVFAPWVLLWCAWKDFSKKR